jgi:hypothetical protein
MPNVQYLGRIPGFGEEFAANFNPMVEGAQRLSNFVEGIRTAHLREALAQATVEKQQLENRINSFGQEQLEVSTKELNELAAIQADQFAQEMGLDSKAAKHVKSFATQMSLVKLQEALGSAKASQARAAMMKVQAENAPLLAALGILGESGKLSPNAVGALMDKDGMGKNVPPGLNRAMALESEYQAGRATKNEITIDYVISKVKDPKVPPAEKKIWIRTGVAMTLGRNAYDKPVDQWGKPIPGAKSQGELAEEDSWNELLSPDKKPTLRPTAAVETTLDFPFGSSLQMPGTRYDANTAWANLDETPPPVKIKGALNKVDAEATQIAYADLALVHNAAQTSKGGALGMIGPGGDAGERIRTAIMIWDEQPLQNQRQELDMRALRDRLKDSSLPENQKISVLGAARTILTSPNPQQMLDIIEQAWGRNFIVGKERGGVLTREGQTNPVLDLLRELISGDLRRNYAKKFSGR